MSRWVHLAAIVVVASCGSSARVTPDASPPPTCETCWAGCANPPNDRAAYWCVRNCVELCATARDR